MRRDRYSSPLEGHGQQAAVGAERQHRQAAPFRLHQRRDIPLRHFGNVDHRQVDLGGGEQRSGAFRSRCCARRRRTCVAGAHRRRSGRPGCRARRWWRRRRGSRACPSGASAPRSSVRPAARWAPRPPASGIRRRTARWCSGRRARAVRGPVFPAGPAPGFAGIKHAERDRRPVARDARNAGGSNPIAMQRKRQPGFGLLCFFKKTHAG